METSSFPPPTRIQCLETSKVIKSTLQNQEERTNKEAIFVWVRDKRTFETSSILNPKFRLLVVSSSSANIRDVREDGRLNTVVRLDFDEMFGVFCCHGDKVVWLQNRNDLLSLCLTGQVDSRTEGWTLQRPPVVGSLGEHTIAHWVSPHRRAIYQNISFLPLSNHWTAIGGVVFTTNIGQPWVVPVHVPITQTRGEHGARCI